MAQISRSRSRSRSRSVTPGPEAASEHHFITLAPREPQMEEEPKLWRPTTTCAVEVKVTPGDSFHAGISVDNFQSPHGSMRLKISPKESLQKSIHVAVPERAAEMDLEQEEGEEAVQSNRGHIEKWMRSWPTPESPSRAPRAAPGGGGGPRGAPRGPPAAPPAARARPTTARIDHDGSEFDSDFDDEFDMDTFAASAGAARDIPDDDELNEPERIVVNNISRAMDEAVDRLVNVSTDFAWRDNFDTFGGRPEVFSGPTPGPIDDYDVPYEAFTSIWSRDFMEHIVRETNRYAEQTIEETKAAGKWNSKSRLYRWVDTGVDEMYVFFAIHIFMGIGTRSSQHEYWKTTGFLQMPNFRKLMSFNRYILLNKCIHFADNSDASRNLPHNEGVVISAKLAKIAPVVDHLNSKFSKLYNLQQDIAIDESLTLFKGRLSWAQAMRSKAARVGIKSFELCESRTGYLWKFEIYTGKSCDRSDSAPGADLAAKSTQVVLDLLKGLEHRGHLITIDNFYNCPSLSRYLKSLGFDNLGTLRPNRKHVPVEIAKAPKNVPKGTIIARHSGDVSCLAWKDSKMVYMISTYHTDETCTSRKSGRDHVKPVSIRDYNNTMGGVDLKDQKLSMYLLERKRCMKWYMKIFKRLLNVSVLNAFIMLSESSKRRGKSLLAHRDFREQLAESLVKKHHTCPPSAQAVPATPSEGLRLRRDILHVPKLTRGNRNRKSCHVCYRNGKRKLVSLSCEVCDEFMCPGECWTIWHSYRHLPGKDVNTRKSRRD